MSASATPPGWPRDLPPPYVDEFAQNVPGWLLDRGPGRWRTHPVLRRHPRALALMVSDHLQAELAGLRKTYAAARRTLADVVPADQMDDLLAAIEAEGAVTAESLRQVEQVADALAGRRWRARL